VLPVAQRSDVLLAPSAAAATWRAAQIFSVISLLYLLRCTLHAGNSKTAGVAAATIACMG
jgi:hypothetical protein